tara:strand:+ start:3698 stop:4084 length:387 start_codon:yes stop_codon:yes gene_type:complete
MLETKLNKCIRVAFPVSQEIQRSKKHVSLIVRKNEIVSVGTNNFRTHPMAKKFGYRFEEVHSELDALLRYRGPKDNLTLVNFRYNRFGDMRISKPCSKCLPWCVSLFDNIWHSTNEGMQRLNIEDYNV